MVSCKTRVSCPVGYKLRDASNLEGSARRSHPSDEPIVNKDQ